MYRPTFDGDGALAQLLIRDAQNSRFSLSEHPASLGSIDVTQVAHSLHDIALPHVRCIAG